MICIKEHGRKMNDWVEIFLVVALMMGMLLYAIKVI